MKETPLRLTALLLALLCLTAGCAQHESQTADDAALSAREALAGENRTASEAETGIGDGMEPGTDGENKAQNTLPESEKAAPETEITAGESVTENETSPEEPAPETEAVQVNPAPEKEAPPDMAASPRETAFSPVGSWSCYLPDSRQDVLWLELRADGSYTVTVDEDSILWAWERETPYFTYAGRWDAAEDGSLTLLLEETGDPFFEGWTSLGDYRFTRLTDCDGEELAELRQLNNGDGLYTRFFLGKQPWLFRRAAERADVSEPERETVFTARVWKIAYEPTFRLWTETVTVDGDGIVRDPCGRCTVYEVKSTESTSLLSGGPEGLLALGNTVYRFHTDAEGRIVSADSVYTGPAPTEEEALWRLSLCEEAQAYMDSGMRVLCEGSGRIMDGMFVTFMTLGTDREEQFVREIRYAVNPEGWVLRYDPVFDKWSWVG